MLPSKPITVFRTVLPTILYGLTKTGSIENDKGDALVKGEANIKWSKCENYKWVWENAVKDSVTFHAQLVYDTLDYRVAVTAQFEPEDLTYYLMRFGTQ